jgi:hypothetical protein
MSEKDKSDAALSTQPRDIIEWSKRILAGLRRTSSTVLDSGMSAMEQRLFMESELGSLLAASPISERPEVKLDKAIDAALDQMTPEQIEEAEQKTNALLAELRPKRLPEREAQWADCPRCRQKVLAPHECYESVLNEAGEREAFEKWLLGIGASPNALRRDAADNYENAFVNAQFSGWMAGIAPRPELEMGVDWGQGSAWTGFYCTSCGASNKPCQHYKGAASNLEINDKSGWEYDPDAALRRVRAEREAWISVNERLPEFSGTYIVAVNGPGDDGEAYIGTLPADWSITTKHWHDLRGWGHSEVTHWMPIPTAPGSAAQKEKK